MPAYFPGALLVAILAAAILPPGYATYFGSYAALAMAILAIAIYGWQGRATLLHPASLAVIGAILLVAVTVPFSYQGPEDLLAPVLILPMISAVAIGMLALPNAMIPSPRLFAIFCLVGSGLALLGGAYENFVMGVYRPGMGNNPIHFSSLAVMSGGLALVGLVSTEGRWRFIFLLGPVFGLGAALVADSRGPMSGAIAMAIVGVAMLATWYRREPAFRWSVLAAAIVGIITLMLLATSGGQRALGLFNSAMNIFRLTGSHDDIRAMLYLSALQALSDSPIHGQGMGQLLSAAQAMFPGQPEMFTLGDLHADWANFAVMSGAIGLLAYLLLLAAPLLLLLDRRARQDRPILLGATLLVVGQLTLGVSNAMFGILPQTTLYAVVLGYFLFRARSLVNMPPQPSSHGNYSRSLVLRRPYRGQAYRLLG